MKGADQGGAVSQYFVFAGVNSHRAQTSSK